MIRELVTATRSVRRFDENVLMKRDDLVELVDIARLTGAASNMQPLKYLLSCDKKTNALIFPTLYWARYIEQGAPQDGERPGGYIVILGDRQVTPRPERFGMDVGVVGQTIALAAREMGFGACMLVRIDKEMLRHNLRLTAQYTIELVVALGVQAETIVIDEIEPGDSIKYYRDEGGVHHVPKRKLHDLIVETE